MGSAPPPSGYSIYALVIHFPRVGSLMASFHSSGDATTTPLIDMAMTHLLRLFAPSNRAPSALGGYIPPYYLKYSITGLFCQVLFPGSSFGGFEEGKEEGVRIKGGRFKLGVELGTEAEGVRGARELGNLH